MRDHAPTAQDPRTTNEAQAPNPYNLAPERLRGEAMAAEAKAPGTARKVSIDRADVLQVAGELLGVRRDNHVEAMHHAGLTIRALQQRIDVLTEPQNALKNESCEQCAGHGQIIGWLCNEDCPTCLGTGKKLQPLDVSATASAVQAGINQLHGEIIRLRTELAAAREAEPLSMNDRKVLVAATFAAEAYKQLADHGAYDEAGAALGVAFCAALNDPLDPSLDYLRTDPSEGARARASAAMGG
ncbi:hypothetical protein [Ketogulonicigenium vulgare]|uniref:hypothetical protein n=1 Tax=Ketogulonicigenium vulgare TaxID=92945 RepID=UPI0023592E73|nr:hypothetical protein [Ketogulonicigenium vulgare]